jgi:Xaa-Pro aminopeptidase
MNRLEAITGALATKGVDGILISGLKNVRYLSGFSGSNGCILITKGEYFFFTDPRYEEQSMKETRGFEILIEREERPKRIVETAKAAGVKIMGFESTASYAFYRSLLRKGLVIKAVSNLVEDLRLVKDRREMVLLGKAVERAERSFLEVRPFIKRGASERSIAAMLEERLKKNGCDTLPFDIIVASGRNSSMPHAKPTERKIEAGDLVVVDWGGEAGGYFSDMTRSFLVKGKNLEKKKEIYGIVLRANMKAIGAVSEGVHVRSVDGAAREEIKAAGYDGFFGHGTGHGVGLDVHELPRVSRLGRATVKAGMVFTVEPGIYLPGIGGVRIEDMVVAGQGGCKVLTALPKDLEILH